MELLDRKILYELGRNARLSYSQIAKEIKSKKANVAYHVQAMEKTGVIWKYVPVVSISRLGIYTHKIYFRFHGLSRAKKRALVDRFMKDKYIHWVAECVGAWDLLIAIYARNTLEFAARKSEIFEQCGEFVQDYAITLLEDALVFNRDYLLQQDATYRKEFIFGGKIEVETIDDAQKKILRHIRNDGRFSLLNLAKKCGSSARTVQSKIKDLETRGIIQGYTMCPNLNKTQLHFFKLCIYLQEYKAKQYAALFNYCRANKNVIHLIKAIGDWELEAELEAENLDFIYDFVEDLKTRFPNTVKKIDLVIIKNEPKLEFFPEWY
ncbi:AsnC family transcriptional regulator [Candidatus Woesearchaeota archaeon]|nr:AsnC family transcriptional regulator [Candidatus Woesearchaeota archaeon]